MMPNGHGLAPMAPTWWSNSAAAAAMPRLGLLLLSQVGHITGATYRVEHFERFTAEGYDERPRSMLA
jgi:hypothetical protein